MALTQESLDNSFSEKLFAALREPQAVNELKRITRNVVEHDIFGRRTDSLNVDSLSWLSAGLTSSDYALAHMQDAKRVHSNHDLLRFAVNEVSVEGLFLEFGVFSGTSVTTIANAAPNAKVYGFDSFEGLPEEWRPGFPQGAFSLAQLPNVPSNVELIVGWFDRTLPSFSAEHKNEKIALMHVDCDLYSSTQTVFAQLKGNIVPGTIIVFDEYFNYPGWQQHEAKALTEFCQSTGMQYKYIALVPSHQQVAIRVIG